VATDLGERHLDGPAADEPTQDVDRIGLEIGAQKGLRPQFAGDVAHHDIADRHEASGMMPQRSAG